MFGLPLGSVQIGVTSKSNQGLPVRLFVQVPTCRPSTGKIYLDHSSKSPACLLDPTKLH